MVLKWELYAQQLPPPNQALTMPDDALYQRARAGDIAALETLLSGGFNDSRAQARVQIDRPKLQVILETTQPLEMEASTGQILETIANLSIQGIQTVSIYARRIGEYFPDWGQTSNLANLKLPLKDYEFTSSQNVSLNQLTHRMQMTSYCLIGIGLALMTPGILFFLSGAIEHVRGGAWVILPGLAQSLFPGLLLLVDGCSKLWGSRKLGLIVTTEGHDIEHLMSAVKLFRQTHGVMAWVSLFGFLFAILTAVLFLPIFFALLEL